MTLYEDALKLRIENSASEAFSKLKKKSGFTVEELNGFEGVNDPEFSKAWRQRYKDTKILPKLSKTTAAEFVTWYPTYWLAYILLGVPSKYDNYPPQDNFNCGIPVVRTKLFKDTTPIAGMQSLGRNVRRKLQQQASQSFNEDAIDDSFDTTQTATRNSTQTKAFNVNIQQQDSMTDNIKMMRG